MATRGSSELLTTSEAARLLGSSRQHVVNLCERGHLRFTYVGAHRRIRRDDLDRQNPDRSLRREQLLALWWGRVVAAHVATDPEGVLAQARARIDVMRATHPESERWLSSWERVLAGGPERVMSMLTSTSPLAIELRATSPFTGVLAIEERDRVLTAFQSYWRASNP